MKETQGKWVTVHMKETRTLPIAHTYIRLILYSAYPHFHFSYPYIHLSACAQPVSPSCIDLCMLFSFFLYAYVIEWSEFAKNVSGEWDGYGAEFSPEGKPFELPESVVPEAYREWEVKVFDWQTQCPTLVESDDFVAKFKLIKLLPTVGCEADAATRHSVDERNISGSNHESAFAYDSSGCFVAVWPAKDSETNSLLELEHCLVNPQNRESRIRVIQVVRVENFKFRMQKIKVFVEQWYGPFRNGEQLGGCSIRDTSFASTEALKSSDVSGVWKGLNAVAAFQKSQDVGLLFYVDSQCLSLNISF